MNLQSVLTISKPFIKPFQTINQNPGRVLKINLQRR
nr:MAG TPA: hypothetical protein [Caudoviricetes sp.]